ELAPGMASSSILRPGRTPGGGTSLDLKLARDRKDFVMRLFRLFERLLEPTALPADTVPPSGLLAFYWFYARQARWLVAALFVAGFLVAALDTTIPVFIGRVVTLISGHRPEALLREAGPQLLGMMLVLLVLRPTALLMQALITNQAIAASLTNLIRWQSPR